MYSIGIDASMGRSMDTATGSTFSSGSLYFSTASDTMRTYRSKPTPSIWPDCSSPRRLPVPRNSKSFMATSKPEPSAVFCAIVASLSWDCSVIGLDGSYRK